MQSRTEFCKSLSDARKARKFSTYWLSEISGVSREEISKIEHGRHSTGIDKILKLVSAMGCRLIIEEIKHLDG
ncbi:MAG: helix-turn-helix domain-containing protein [Prevotellaceae bacterium]|jgi:predicted transcriptional regulator|nr:helix-turn-helix domain-containing protein [Prevotellaceae bacterium]